jgi:hypothetical protein
MARQGKERFQTVPNRIINELSTEFNGAKIGFMDVY